MSLVDIRSHSGELIQCEMYVLDVDARGIRVDIKRICVVKDAQ